MPIRYEWADDSHLILNFYIEFPWTWTEYNQLVDEVMPMLAELKTPCATAVDTTKMGSLPKDGNAIRNLMNLEQKMPENLFASVVVGSNYMVRVFMNLLMKLRPRAQRMTLFTKTMEEAHEKIRERHKQLLAEVGDQV